MARRYHVLDTDDDSSIVQNVPVPPAAELPTSLRDSLKIHLDQALSARIATIKEVESFIKEIEESYDKSRKAKIGGTAATISGSVVGIVGFGLAFVTLGASIPLMVLGGIAAAAGGATIAGADIGYFAVSENRLKQIKLACERDNNNTTELRDTLERIKDWVDQYCAEHPDVTSEELLGTLCGSKTSIPAYSMLTGGGRAVAVTTDVAKIGTIAARVALEGFGVAGKAVGAVAVAFDAILIPVDIVTMAKAIYDVHQYNGGDGKTNATAAINARKTTLEKLKKHQKHMQQLYGSINK